MNEPLDLSAGRDEGDGPQHNRAEEAIPCDYARPPRRGGRKQYLWGATIVLGLIALLAMPTLLRVLARPRVRYAASETYGLFLMGIAIDLYNDDHHCDPPDLLALLEPLDPRFKGQAGAPVVTEPYLRPEFLVFAGSGLDPAETTDPEDVEAHTASVFAWGLDPNEAPTLVRGFSFPAFHGQQWLHQLQVGAGTTGRRDLWRFMSDLQETNDHLAERRAGR